MTIMQPTNSNPEQGGSHRMGTVAWILVISGALAWIVALGAVLMAAAGHDDNSSDSAPEVPDRVVLGPTLGAASATPTVTPLPTATATPLPTATPRESRS